MTYGNRILFSLGLTLMLGIIPGSILSAQTTIDIWSAIESNDMTTFQTWLAGKPDVNILDSETTTPLFHATAYVNPAMVSLLIAKGANVKLVTKYGNTVLFSLFDRTNVPTKLADIESITSQLLAKGAAVNAVNNEGDTPLIRACNSGGYRADHGATAIDLLLAAGASPNDKNKNGEAALYFAVMRSSAEVVRSLIKHGVDVNARFASNTTALLWAAQNKNTEILQILLEAGADPNLASNSNNTPILLLVQENKNLEAVKLLIAYKADVNVKNKDGRTPLSLAGWSAKYNAPIIKALTDAGAK